MDRLTMGQTIPDFPKTVEELRALAPERRIALLACFDVGEREAIEMGEEAGMLALKVWSGCAAIFLRMSEDLSRSGLSF